MRTYEAACTRARGQRGAEASAAATPLARRGFGSGQRLQLDGLYDTGPDGMDVDGEDDGAAAGAAAAAGTAAAAAAEQGSGGGGVGWAVAGGVFEYVPAVWAELRTDLDFRNSVRESERLIKVRVCMCPGCCSLTVRGGRPWPLRAM